MISICSLVFRDWYTHVCVCWGWIHLSQVSIGKGESGMREMTIHGEVMVLNWFIAEELIRLFQWILSSLLFSNASCLLHFSLQPHGSWLNEVWHISVG